jgi:SanA protein
MKYFLIILTSLIITGVSAVLCAYLINWRVSSYSLDKIYLKVEDVPKEEPLRIAIVYGAAVYQSGKLSDALYDRVFTAVELYKAGKVKKLLMSGDNSRPGYDEPTAMKNEAVKLGVAEEDIIMDFAGRRTYDTCHRAKEIFEVEKAIHVTQEFHLPRAIYLCENVGVGSIGIKADRRKYLDEKAWAGREFLAVLSAWLEINFYPFEPISGEIEPIKQ